MSQSDSEVQGAEWNAAYLERRKYLEDARAAGSAAYDKAIMAVSSGALGLSMLFVKDIVRLDQASWIFLLILAWIALTVSILSVVQSFQSSQVAFDYEIAKWDEFHQTGDAESLRRENPESPRTKSLNQRSGALLIVGIVLLGAFLTINLIQGAGAAPEEYPNEKAEQHGSDKQTPKNERACTQQ